MPADAPAPCSSKILRSPAHLDALLHDHAVDYGLWNKLFSADLLTEEMLDNGLAYNEDLLANWRAFLAAPGCAFCDLQATTTASTRPAPATPKRWVHGKGRHGGGHQPKGQRQQQAEVHHQPQGIPRGTAG